MKINIYNSNCLKEVEINDKDIKYNKSINITMIKENGWKNKQDTKNK
jgi:hypothetical protein